MAYTIPNWIPGAPDLAQQFLGGLRAGSEIAAQQAQLNQEANLAQMRAIAQQQQFERENALEQQRLVQQQAYQTAQIGIQKQELQQAQQLNQIKIQQAARTFQAQQSFQQWLQDNPDKDPAEGILKFFPGTDANFTGAGTLAMALSRERASLKPPEFGSANIEGQNYPYALTRSSTGGYNFHQLTPRGAQSSLGKQMIMDELRNMEKDRRDLMKELNEEPAARDVERISKLPPDKQAAELAKLNQTFVESYRQKKDELAQLNRDIAAFRRGELSDEATPPPPSAAPDVIRSWNPKTQSWEGGATAPAAAPAPLGPPAPQAPSAPLNTPYGVGIGSNIGEIPWQPKLPPSISATDPPAAPIPRWTGSAPIIPQTATNDLLMNLKLPSWLRLPKEPREITEAPQTNQVPVQNLLNTPWLSQPNH